MTARPLTPMERAQQDAATIGQRTTISTPTTNGATPRATIPTTPPAMVDRALDLARRGFHVFPIQSGAKKPPLIQEFPNQATCDEDQVREWWTRWPDANTGISTTHYGDNEALLVVDIDNKGDKHGDEEILRLELEGRELPETYAVSTPTGGRHLYYVVPTAVRQGADVLARGVDIRSKGGYVVAPGSTVELGVYTALNDRALAPAPQWVIDACGAVKEKTAAPVIPIEGVNQGKAAARAKAYLLNDAPLALEGDGGDDTTFKIICRVKDLGVDADMAEALISEHWNPRCQPPWSDEDLHTKVANAYRYGQAPVGVAAPEVEFSTPVESDDPTLTKYEFKKDWTDTGNANLLVSLAQGNLKYIPEKRTWMTFTSGRWQSSQTRSLAERAALRVAEFYHEEIAKLEAAGKALDEAAKKRNAKTIETTKTWEHKCRSKKSLDAMIALAATKPQIELSVTALDTNPLVIGVQNGVVDLRTGALRQAARDEYVTMACPVVYDPAATAPTWERVIREVTALPGDTPTAYRPRPDLAEFLQTVLGYAMTGLTREHKMVIFNGGGSNAKNVVADAVRHGSGPYSTSLPPSCLLQSKLARDGERPTPYAADLFRKRFVVASETKAGFRLDTDFVKSQTGDTYQKARYLRENPFEFESSHTLFLMTNSLPEIDHLDEAIRGRLIVIPFDRTWNRPGHPDPDPALPMADETLPARLRDEAPGILRWLVEGAVQYLAHGLGKAPEAVKTKTLDYLADQDSLTQWIAACCERCESHKDGMTPSDLCQAYNTWAGENDAPDLSQREFSTGMKSRRFEAKGVWKDGESLKRYALRLKPTGGWDD